jgi:polysaccharide pyruvyl transferase WcaK-like protein
MTAKIGITTYYDSYNEGTMLQAYSVKTLLKQAFPLADVEIVRYRDVPRSFPKYLADFRKPRRNYYRVLRETKAKRFVRENICTPRHQLVTADYKEALTFVRRAGYDMIVTGSDTVWQIGNDAFPNIYWLPKELTCLKAAMAVSANKTRIDRLDAASRQWISACLEEYLAIGVRDDLTYQLVSEICPGLMDRLLRVPDPTFGIDFPTTAIRQKLIRAGFDLSRPIIGFNLPDTPLTRSLIQHYHNRSYQLLPLALYNDLIYLPGVRCVSMSPFEWAEIYKYLSLSITERFHGTVFSVKSKCPMLVLDFDERYRGLPSKTYSLLKEFQLANRHVRIYEKDMRPEELASLAAACEENLDADTIDAILTMKKASWKRYFDELRKRIPSLLDACA